MLSDMHLLNLSSLSTLSLTAISITLFIISIAILSKTYQTRIKHLPPGPWGLPFIGHLHLLEPIVHHTFQTLSARYGPILYLNFGNVPAIIVSSPDLAKEFLKTHELTFSSRKHSSIMEHMTYNSGFALAPYGPYWKFIKRLITLDVLGTKSLAKFQSMRRRECNRFLKVLMMKAKDGASVNLTEEFLTLTNNVISQMMIGVRNSEIEGRGEEIRVLIREVTVLFGEFNMSDFVWILKGFDFNGLKKRVNMLFDRYDGLLEKILSEREAHRRCGNGDEKSEDHVMKDFLDILLDVMDDEHAEVKLTRNHIKALILDYFTAATDTSAILLEWAMAELINNEHIMQTARNEIDNIVGQNRIVEESDIPNLPYIQSIMKETLRLHPPIPVISRKATKQVTIAGYTIPKDSILYVNIWDMGRNKKYWADDPLEFRPNRFLNCDGLDVKGQNFEVLPFGSGRRGCPGMTLAMMELPMVLACMIQCFDWKVVGFRGDEKLKVDMTERPGLTAPRAHDLVCVPVARAQVDECDIFKC